MPPGSTTSRVHDYLDADGPAREMLARDVVNVRALARWLQDLLDLDASEEGIVSAIRRYPRVPDESTFQRAREVIAGAHMHSRSNVCAFSLPRTAETHTRLADLFDHVNPDRGELLRVIEGVEATKVIVGGSKAKAVRRTLHPSNVRDERSGLAEYALIPPERAQHTPGVLALVHSTVASRGINVVDSASGGNELLLFVDEDDSLPTYRTLDRLCSGTT